jgi:hypothetical protein
MANVIKFEALEVEVLIGIANESAELVEASARKAVEHAERCGRALLAAKEKVAHGQWLGWIGANFNYTRQHAHRYMTIASNVTRVLPLKDATSIREALRMIAEDPETPKRERKPSVEVVEVAADEPADDVPVAAEIVAADMPAVEVITAVATVKPAKKRAAAEPDVISKTFATLSPQKKMAELRKLSADPDVMRIRSEKQTQEMRRGYKKSAVEGASNFITQAANELHKYQTNFGADFRWLPGAMKTTEGFAEVLSIIRRLDQIAINATAYSKTLNEKTRGNRGDD